MSATATALLIAACFFDLRSGRFPNWLFVMSFIVALILKTYHVGWILAVQHALLSLGLFIILVPFVLRKAIGAGDAKLMMSFTLLTGFFVSLNVLAYSLFWGLLIGVFRMAISGHLMTFATSFVLKTPQVKSQKIPYTFALLLGWMSFFSVGGLV